MYFILLRDVAYEAVVAMMESVIGEIADYVTVVPTKSRIGVVCWHTQMAETHRTHFAKMNIKSAVGEKTGTVVV